MTTKARVHAHDEDEVNLVNRPLQHIQRLGRVEHQTGFHTLALDGLDAAVHMRTRIRVKADVVRASFGKRCGQSVHRRNHQMHINRHSHASGRFGMWLQGLANHGAEREVGHIVVVHHVEMNPISASGDDVFHLVAQAGEVGRQDGGGDVELRAWADHGVIISLLRRRFRLRPKSAHDALQIPSRSPPTIPV